MKNLSIFWGIAAFLMIAFFLYSFWIAPFSVHHGYYVGAAKLMAEGLVPFKDFNIMDFPLGIWIISLVYRIVGVTTSGNAAVVFLMFIHLVNIGLLDYLMKQMNIQKIYRFFSLFFYVLVLYSTDSLMVNLEPFAVTFLVLALIFQTLHHVRYSLFLSALFLVLSVCCKYQVITLVPAVVLMTHILKDAGENGWKKSLRLTALFLVGGLVAYILIAVVCKESMIVNHFDLELDYFSLRSLLTLFSILAARCSLYLLLPGLIAYKMVSKKTMGLSYIAILAFVGISVWLLFMRMTNSIGHLLYPFVILALASGIQEVTIKKRWMWGFYITLLIMPGYLCIRDYKALEDGNLKEEQSAYLEITKDFIHSGDQISVLVDKSHDYDLGTQFYSEIPGVKPVDMKHTKWGLISWVFSELPKEDQVRAAITDADCIICNNDFLNGFYFISYLNNETWGEEFRYYRNERDAIGLGELYLMLK